MFRANLPATVAQYVEPLDGGGHDYDSLLEAIGDRRFVLLGEASHGTHEFYRERAKITKRLIDEKRFDAVAIEGDFPDAYGINLFVRGKSLAANATEALGGFGRFPQWMWRNVDVVDFVGWLREHNERNDREVGFFGLDLYSLYTSIDSVLTHLARLDPEAASRARARYACFDHFGGDTQAYAYATAIKLGHDCEKEVLDELVELRRRASQWLAKDGRELAESVFFIEQNARLIKNAESYYRHLFGHRISTWNLRDTHMIETLDAIGHHLDRPGKPSRIVVWAHNSHLGDARATQMGQRGEHNVGQLARERYGHEAFLVGFTTYEGTVTASSDWDGEAERKTVRPALAQSYEALFHQTAIPRFFARFAPDSALYGALPPRLLERAIGVIYRPDTERASHYFYADLPRQFDAVIHIDHTRAVEPIERTPLWTSGEAPETYPEAV